MPIIDSRTSIPAGTNRDNPVIVYDQISSTSTITANEQVAQHPASNLRNPSTSEYWLSTDGSSFVDIDFAAPETISCITVAPHNLSNISISSFNAGVSDQIIFSTFVGSSRSPVIILFDPVQSDSIRISCSTSLASGPIRIGHVMIGTAIVLPSRIYVGHTPVNYGRNTSVLTGMSESGEFLGRVTTGETLGSEFSMKNVDPQFYRSDIEPFAVAAISKPFAFAWRPQSYPKETGYCWATSNIVPSNSNPNGMMEFKVNYKAHSPWS